MKKAAVIALLFLLPFLDPNPYHIEIFSAAALNVLLALGLHLIVGCAGLLHLGYAAFFAIGAYTYGLLNLSYHCPFWLGLPLSAVTAGIFGVVLGLPAMRVRGDYLAIVTLGFGEIVRIVVTNLEIWTGGPNGLLGIHHPTLGFYNFGVESRPYYWLLLVLVVLTTWVSRRLIRSRIGLAWAAIREDELAARCLGIDASRLKLLALGLGGAIAGIAGSVFASKQGTITPDSFDFIFSVMILAAVILGGLGSVSGVLVGAVVLTVLPELLRSFSSYRMILFGALLIVLMRYRPQGLLGLSQIRRQLKVKNASSAG